MNREETARIVYMLSATLQSQARWVNDEDALIDGWHMALEHIPYAEAQHAARSYLRRGKWFPAPAELLALVAEARGVCPPPGRGWSLVQDYLRRRQPGVSDPGALPAPVRQAVKDIGGWDALHRSDRPDRDRAAFDRAYADRAADVIEAMAEGGERLPALNGAAR